MKCILIFSKIIYNICKFICINAWVGGCKTCKQLKVLSLNDLKFYCMLVMFFIFDLIRKLFFINKL